MQIGDAQKMLDSKDMQYQVIDSVYKPDKAPGMVMEQSPAAGSKIKSYRSIYITINAKMPPGVALPDVRDLSLRHVNINDIFITPARQANTYVYNRTED